MARNEYIKISISLMPYEITKEYNMEGMAQNVYVYYDMQRGMYGLNQAGIIANDVLTQHLAPHGYYQTEHTPGLWKHNWRPIMFSLVVNDFVVQCVGKQHTKNMYNKIQNYYELA